MAGIPKDQILEWGIMFLCGVIINLFGAFIFFLKRILDDNRSAHTKTEEHFADSDKDRAELKADIREIKAICKERSGRCTANGKSDKG